MILDQKLNWKEHINYVYNKAIKVLHELKYISSKFWGLGTKAIRTIYTAAVEPILTYGAAVWHYSVNKRYIKRKLLSAQRMAAISICKAYRTAPTNTLLILAKLTPIHLKIKQIALKDIFTGTNWNKNITNDHIDIPHELSQLFLDLKSFGIDQSSFVPKHPALRNNNSFLTGLPNNREGLHVYTNGSKTKCGVGASVIIANKLDRTLFQGSYKLQQHLFCSASRTFCYLQRTQHYQ